MRRERQALGLGETRGVASLISGLTPRERRALHEAVKRRILREQGGGGDEIRLAEFTSEKFNTGDPYLKAEYDDNGENVVKIFSTTESVVSVILEKYKGRTIDFPVGEIKTHPQLISTEGGEFMAPDRSDDYPGLTATSIISGIIGRGQDPENKIIKFLAEDNASLATIARVTGKTEAAVAQIIPLRVSDLENLIPRADSDNPTIFEAYRETDSDAGTDVAYITFSTHERSVFQLTYYKKQNEYQIMVLREKGDLANINNSTSFNADAPTAGDLKYLRGSVPGGAQFLSDPFKFVADWSAAGNTLPAEYASAASAAVDLQSDTGSDAAPGIPTAPATTKKKKEVDVEEGRYEEDEKAPAKKQGYEVGTEIMGSDGRTPIFVKTAQGWKATLRISADDVLKFVKESAKEIYKKQIKSTPVGGQIVIDGGALISRAVTNTKVGSDDVLVFVKEADGFADPVVIPDGKIEGVVRSVGAKMPDKKEVTVKPLKQGTYYIGDVRVEVTSSSATMYIPNDDDLSGFDEIFGRGSKATERVRTALAGRQRLGGLTVKLPTKGAPAGSLIYKIDKKAWIGDKISFTLDDTSEFWVASTGKAGRTRGAEEELQKLVKTGQAAGQELEVYSRKLADDAPDGTTFMVVGSDNRTKNYMIKTDGFYQSMEYYTVDDVLDMLTPFAKNSTVVVNNTSQGNKLKDYLRSLPDNQTVYLLKTSFNPAGKKMLLFNRDEKTTFRKLRDEFINSTLVDEQTALDFLDRMASSGVQIRISLAKEQ